MFGKEKDELVQPGPSASTKSSDGRTAGNQSSAAPSIISADMKVVGDLQSAGDIQVEGSVEGDIKSRTVTIGEKAHISGSVNADTANILGGISGKIFASAVRIAKTANVQGDINYRTLSIEEGAVINGQISRRDENAKSEAAPKSQSSATGDANVAPIKPSMGKPSDVPNASGMKPSSSKPLAR